MKELSNNRHGRTGEPLAVPAKPTVFPDAMTLAAPVVNVAEDVLRVKVRVLERDGGDEVDEPREVREGRYSCRHRNWLATGMSPLRILVEFAEEGLGGGVGHREEKQKAEMGKLK